MITNEAFCYTHRSVPYPVIIRDASSVPNRNRYRDTQSNTIQSESLSLSFYQSLKFHAGGSTKIVRIR